MTGSNGNGHSRDLGDLALAAEHEELKARRSSEIHATFVGPLINGEEMNVLLKGGLLPLIGM